MYIYWKKEWTAPALVGAASFATGLGAGYLVSRRKHLRELDELIEVVAELKQDALVMYPVPTVEQVTIIDDPAWTQVEVKLDPSTVLEDVVDVTAMAHNELVAAMQNNVFEDDWNQAEEDADRTEDAPYILHVEEFVNNEKGYTQSTLEWYDGDKILADENNVPIYGAEKIVGHLQWGRGSRDPNTVYIRNDQLRAEYEIVRNAGSYQMEVLGLEADAAAEETDLKHSNSIRRFRHDRE